MAPILSRCAARVHAQVLVGVWDCGATPLRQATSHRRAAPIRRAPSHRRAAPLRQATSHRQPEGTAIGPVDGVSALLQPDRRAMRPVDAVTGSRECGPHRPPRGAHTLTARTPNPSCRPQAVPRIRASPDPLAAEPHLATRPQAQDMDPVIETRRRGGVARTADLRAAGCTRYAISSAVRRGALVAPRRGIVAVADLPDGAHAALSIGGALTCASALSALGLPSLEPSPTLHVAVPRDFSGARPGHVRLHYTESVPAGATVPIATVLDHLGTCTSPVAQLVAVDAALHNGRLTLRQVEAFTSTPASRRRWLVSSADPRAESPLETVARVALVEGGLKVQPQAYIDGVGRVDLLVEDRLVIELDGRATHDSLESFRRDRARDRELIVRGYGVLRYAYPDVVGSSRKPILIEAQRALAAIGSETRRAA